TPPACACATCRSPPRRSTARSNSGSRVVMAQPSRWQGRPPKKPSYLVPFQSLYADVAKAETRSITTRGYPGVPDDDYGMFEAYCPDPDCDCRRVMLNVVSRRQNAHIATISYGFDRDDEFAGPF